MTTVTCVYVRGEYPYSPQYVTRLYQMVKKFMDRTWRFVCLTDQPWLFDLPIVTVPIRKLPGFAPWSKLELFNPDRQWQGRMLYLDLDSLLVSSLAPILDAPADFAITADPPSRQNPRRLDSFGRTIVRRFNSSVMVWDGGTQTELYTTWRPDFTTRLSGDQDWIGERLPHAATLPRAWFPRLSEAKAPPWPAEAKVVLCKVPKNHVAAQQWTWFAPLWGAA